MRNRIVVEGKVIPKFPKVGTEEFLTVRCIADRVGIKTDPLEEIWNKILKYRSYDLQAYAANAPSKSAQNKAKKVIERYIELSKLN